MKQARASHAEWEALVLWFQSRENTGESVPQWRRVVFGYDVLFSNAGDPAKDYLDFKPGTSPAEIAALKAELAHVNAAHAELARHIGEMGAVQMKLEAGVQRRDETIAELERENEALKSGILTCLSYPRGSEAQVRCLEEVGQDARGEPEVAEDRPMPGREP